MSLGKGVEFELRDYWKKDADTSSAVTSRASSPTPHRIKYDGRLYRIIPLGVTVTVQLSLVLVFFYNYDDLYKVTHLGSSAMICASLAGLSQGICQLFITREMSPSKMLKFYVWGAINGLWTVSLCNRQNKKGTAANNLSRNSGQINLA
jgi:hypothetical protein